MSTVELPWLLLGTRLSAGDAVGRVFLLLTVAVWAAAAASVRPYFAGDPRRARFEGLFCASLIGNAGLVLAQDVASFYLCFGWMAFAAYGLVVHEGGARARQAGRVYFALAFASELLLFAALLLIVRGHGNLALEDARRAVAGSPQRDLIVALLLLGFGAKAGALPLHVWLPLAHPVAPTPASAVLSGAMIEAGLLGWLRLLPLGHDALPGFGLICALLGLLAALFGAAAGATQRDAKTVLAYSSISQMGLMTIPLGVALAVPERAVAVQAAILFFALHHALAKAALFLGVAVVGAVPAGFGRSAVLGGLCLLGLAIAGAPLTSGALAKVALHDAIADAPGLHGAWAGWLAWGAVGSALLMIRFVARVAQAKPAARGPAWGLLVPWIALLAFEMLLPLLLPCARPAALGVLVDGAGIAQAAWPLLAGAALAGVVRTLGRRTGRALPEIPAGDLLVPAQAAARALAGTACALRVQAARAIARASRLEALSGRRLRRRAAVGLHALQRGQARLAGFATTGWLAGFVLLLFSALLVLGR